jgi:YhcH/YjgK/YiaL family protein
MYKKIISLYLIAMMISCNHKNDVSGWSDSQINDWFNHSEWVKMNISPDSSINKRLFAEQYHLDPATWNTALRFLRETDFDSISTGKYELDAIGTFATISDYMTRNVDTAFFESHRKYIDIQYVHKGQEYIGTTALTAIKEIVKEYDEEKDIMFFIKDDEIHRLANQTNFFVFFPVDGHKPCLRVNNNSMVRKVVIKIPFKN